MKYLKQALAGSGLLCVSLGAAAAPIYYNADLAPLNNSGASGTATLAYDSSANTLNVGIHATGLEAGQPHAQHIHGVIGGNSVSPTPAADTDGDGYVELAEAQPAYGPILVSLTSPPGGNPLTGPGFPTAPDGTIDFSQTYDLTSAATYNDDYDMANLLPLVDREIVLHGMSVPEGAGAGTDGEVDGSGGYKAPLPVASGVITAQTATTAVPEPGELGMLLLGGSLIGGLLFARKRGSSLGAPRA